MYMAYQSYSICKKFHNLFSEFQVLLGSWNHFTVEKNCVLIPISSAIARVQERKNWLCFVDGKDEINQNGHLWAPVCGTRQLVSPLSYMCLRVGPHPPHLSVSIDQIGVKVKIKMYVYTCMVAYLLNFQQTFSKKKVVY